MEPITLARKKSPMTTAPITARGSLKCATRSSRILIIAVWVARDSGCRLQGSLSSFLRGVLPFGKPYLFRQASSAPLTHMQTALGERG